MSRDELVVGAMLLAFATGITAHGTLVVGLLGRAPRWRGLLALVVPPLAPYWGWTGLRGRSVVWLAAAVGYVVLRILADH
jgi:hypothetical protein